MVVGRSSEIRGVPGTSKAYLCGSFEVDLTSPEVLGRTSKLGKFRRVVFASGISKIQV